MLTNPLSKEYNSGGRHQVNVDYTIFRKSAKEAVTKEKFEKILEGGFNYMTSWIADEDAKESIEDVTYSTVVQR